MTATWLQKFFFLGTIAVGSGCTPSVPIPPPSPEKVSFGLDLDLGIAVFEYAPSASSANAVVYIFNRDIGQGIITTAESDGRVLPTEPFPAMDGDEIVITFETQDQLSSTCVRMADGQSSSAAECSL